MSGHTIEINDETDSNLYNVIFVNRRNNYNIYLKDWDNGKNWWSEKVCKFTTPSMAIPFGVEKYNYKEIVNLEFTGLNENNSVYNFYSKIKQIDTFMINLSKYENFAEKLKFTPSQDLLNKLRGKDYVSCIRQRPGKFDSLLRVHIKKTGKKYTTEIVKYVEGQKVYTSLSEIKGKSGKFRLELGSLWITNTKFGLTLLLDKGITK